MRGPWAIALVLLFAAGRAAATPVRIFAVGHELRLDDVVTHQAFRDRMAALMDASFPGRAGLVQARVDDVASHLAPVDPGAPAAVLVVFPEDAGLATVFVGTRGAPARAQSGVALAIVNLLAAYGGPAGHYATKYPGQPVVRNLVLALTDTIYRAFYETYRDLAVQHGVWIAAGANVAPARRVETGDDPALVALLRDPDEPTRQYAYEAVSPWPVNTTFDPDADTPTNQWHPSLAADRDRLYVAWQDDRLGNDDVFFATSADAGETLSAAERVDDIGAGRSAQTRPRLAIAGKGSRRRCLVVWEDDRDGTRDVRLASRPCPR